MRRSPVLVGVSWISVWTSPVGVVGDAHGDEHAVDPHDLAVEVAPLQRTHFGATRPGDRGQSQRQELALAERLRGVEHLVDLVVGHHASGHPLGSGQRDESRGVLGDPTPPLRLRERGTQHLELVADRALPHPALAASGDPRLDVDHLEPADGHVRDLVLEERLHPVPVRRHRGRRPAALAELLPIGQELGDGAPTRLRGGLDLQLRGHALRVALAAPHGSADLDGLAAVVAPDERPHLPDALAALSDRCHATTISLLAGQK